MKTKERAYLLEILNNPDLWELYHPNPEKVLVARKENLKLFLGKESICLDPVFKIALYNLHSLYKQWTIKEGDSLYLVCEELFTLVQDCTVENLLSEFV